MCAGLGDLAITRCNLLAPTPPQIIGVGIWHRARGVDREENVVSSLSRSTRMFEFL